MQNSGLCTKNNALGKMSKQFQFGIPCGYKSFPCGKVTSIKVNTFTLLRYLFHVQY